MLTDCNENGVYESRCWIITSRFNILIASKFFDPINNIFETAAPESASFQKLEHQIKVVLFLYGSKEHTAGTYLSRRPVPDCRESTRLLRYLSLHVPWEALLLGCIRDGPVPRNWCRHYNMWAWGSLLKLHRCADIIVIVNGANNVWA